MNEREELEALRRLAELEAKAGNSAPQRTTPEMPPMMRALQSAGSGAIRGAGSIGATMLAPLDMLNAKLKGRPLMEGNRQRRADMTAALGNLGFDTDSNFFGAGKLAGEVAGTLGVGGVLGGLLARAAPSAAPVAEAISTAGFRAGGLTGASGIAARTAGGAITGGASAGLVNPEDAGTGAAVGAVLPGALQVAGRAGSAIGSAFKPDPAQADLARKAITEYGIPLSVADVSRNNFVKGMRSALEDTVLVGRAGIRQRDRVQGAFNRAVGKTFGADADSLTPEVIDQAKSRMGSEFDRIWGRNAVHVDVPMAEKLAAMKKEVERLPQGDAKRLDDWLADIASKTKQTPEGDFIIEGETANLLQSKLRQQAEKASGYMREALTDLRRIVLDGFNRNVSPEDAAALAKNMRQYRAFKTVQPLLEKSEAGVAARVTGDVPAGLLPEAVRQSYGSRIADSPFADLSQIGSQYVADRVARTGGSARAQAQNLLLGSGLTFGAMQGPMVPLLALPAMMGAQGLLTSPAVGRAAIGLSSAPAQLGLLAPNLYRAAPVLAADQ